MHGAVLDVDPLYASCPTLIFDIIYLHHGHLGDLCPDLARHFINRGLPLAPVRERRQRRRPVAFLPEEEMS